ncbi:capsule assembly Wzi family protein [Treponema denticola]|uniref:capsule assembly Wzi family protein n=1 Tax=Treponema denticola TaxID=158 RepID=UPI002107B2BC|nr:capsule assembly Wzi family protein [Treponema denticola]UTY23591.1 hypothetical protein E4N78_05165 [Treponema denticola]
MKNKIFIILFIPFGLSVFSQAAVDLFDPFYDDLNIWENIGLINNIPSIRPYPLQEIKRILDIVMEKGDEGQRKKATEHQSRLLGRPFHFGGSTNYKFVTQNNKKQNQFFLSPIAELNYQISSFLTVSGYMDFSLFNKLDDETLLPMYKQSDKDIADDNGTHIGKFRILPMFNTSITIGTPEYYLTGGLSRSSYGPFHDNSIFISKDAFHSGQFIFTVNKEKWTYNQILLLLAATTDKNTGIFPNKFLASHSLDIRPVPWLTFSLIDTMIYGGRFEPIYLIPFSVFYLGQSIYGFPDNTVIGASFTVKPIKGLRFDSALYVDDIGLTQIIKFESALWRMSGQFGISYTMPKSHWFSFVDLGYTFVMPYMYTHVDHHSADMPNYQNYTHHGEPLGSNLPPNSDRIQLKVKFRPIHGLDINLSNAFIRHANTTESITDINILKDYLTKNYATDGSVFNHPTITGSDSTGATTWKDHAFLYSTPFLTQQTIQYVNQLGLEGVINLPILKSGGLMQFKLGYTFEANINPGVNNHIYNEKIPAANLATDAQVLNAANTQLKKWREQAVGKEFNHYFNIGVKISY